MPGKQNPDNNNALAADEGDSGAHTDLIYFHIVSRRNSRRWWDTDVYYAAAPSGYPRIGEGMARLAYGNSALAAGARCPFAKRYKDIEVCCADFVADAQCLRNSR